MRIQNKQRYLIRYLSIFALLISIVIAKTSCKKTDLLTNENSTQLNVRINQFFNLPSNVNPAIARVAKELERQNKKTGFISTLATQAGFPVWDKSSVKLINNNSTNSNSLLEDYEGSDTCILIPMVLIDANHVNAFISATIIDDSVTMRMYYKNDYKAYPFKATQPATGITTAEEFASQMILFDNAVFGYTTFQVKDKRLFHSTTNYSDTTGAKIEIKINDKQPTNGSNNLVYCTVQEYTASYCTTPDDDRCRGGCDNCGFPICWTVIWTQEHCTGGPGNGGGSGWPSSPPSGPGGTGGGGGPTGGGGNCVVGGLIIEGWAPPNPCYPPAGGNPLPPIPSNLLWLRDNLLLISNQVDWLLDRPNRTQEIYDYLELETTPERKQIAKDHLELMRAETAYLNFVENHEVTGDSTKMWWDDINWLRQINFNFPNEDVFNLWNEAAKPKNPKPLGEFANYCDGITHIMTQSINDPQKRERMGYITLDGKFIFTSVGSTDETKVNVKIYYGIVYYTYKTNKGAPLLSYYGMIIKNGEYCIPIRTNIHNHILDGNPNEVPIETNPQKSNGDDYVAQLIQKQTGINNFRLYVIEAKTNGKYITAAFDRVDNNYQIINNNILLNEVCNGIW